MRKVVIIFAIFFFFWPSRVLAVDWEQLKKYFTVEAAILGASDNVSLDFQNLDGSLEVVINPTRSWIPASTIKSFVLVEVFNQVRQGLISFDQTITIRPENVVSTALETEEFPRLREGTRVTIRQLAEAMIIQSDNTAYNSLLDILDRRSINNTLQSFGLTETVVGEKLNLDDSRYQLDAKIPGHQFNTITVKDYVSLFSLLANNKIPGSAEMLAIFKRQKFNDMIPALLPKSVAVAHKTGVWAPIYHDGGVVYKLDEPFILGVFSNANDPSINARLARVAYFQNSDAVGVSMERESEPKKDSYYPVITLAKAPSDQELKVLGTETSSKFPEVTAADLGITSQDLTTGVDDSKNIRPAIVFPGSWLYLVKRGWENLQLALARSSSEKVSLLLNISHARLSEIKALGGANRPDFVSLLVSDEQSSLLQAAGLAKSASNFKPQLAQVKQLSDLSFAVAGDSLDKARGKDKEKLIDRLFESIEKNQKEIAPIVRKSLPTSPFNQPLVGTVKEVKDNKVTVVFTDGRTRTILVTPTTPSRTFGQKSLDREGKVSVAVGSKIAVVGETTKTDEIIPSFILRDVPKEVPEKKEGIVTKIDLQKSSLEVKQTDGEKATVLVDQKTVIKGRDTDVSLTGIKAGSAVIISGSKDKATTITVVKNSSGKDEVKEKKEKDKKEKEKKD